MSIHGGTMTFTFSVTADASVKIGALVLVALAFWAMVVSVKLWLINRNTTMAAIVAASAFALLGLAVGAVLTKDPVQTIKYAAVMVAWLAGWVGLAAIGHAIVANWRRIVAMAPSLHMPKWEIKFTHAGAHRA